MRLICRFIAYRRVYETAYKPHKPFSIPYKRVYERAYEAHKPLKGFIKVLRIKYPLRVYEIQIPFHKSLLKTFERVYENQIPFHKPL